jgi:hypothetical protein
MNIFKKIGRSVGNVFKKGTRAVGNIARKEFYKGVDALPSLGGLGGSAIGSELGEATAIAIDQPELVPVFGAVGGRLGSMAGKELGKSVRDRIRRPLSHGSVGRPKIGDVITTDQRRVDTHTFKVLDTRDQAKKMKDMGVRPTLVPSKQKFISGVPTPKRPFISGVPTPTRPPPNELEKRKAMKEKEQLFA